MKFKSKRPHFEYLRKKWSERHKNLTESLFDKHLKSLALSSLGGLMLLTTPGSAITTPFLLADGNSTLTPTSNSNALLAAELKDKVPDEIRSLTPDEEKAIGNVLTKHLRLPVVAAIQDKRLNRSYGLIGGEQHLYRYPGDNVYAHAKSASDWAMYGSSGIAPGLGAWGYFAPSRDQFTPQDEQKERYYIAVQTFLAPGFAERVGEYRDFFKFRKMLIVNPKTGQAVVTVIGDAGPADWTGNI